MSFSPHYFYEAIQQLKLKGSTSNVVTIEAASATTPYTIFLPSAQAAGANYVLANDGAGNLSWIPSTTGNVTSVTASSPLSSSGGYTPNISLSNNGITNSYLATMPAYTIKGNRFGVSGDPGDLTASQVTAMLNTFTSALQGLVPASGGENTSFLRADGFWAAPIITNSNFAPAPAYTVKGNNTGSIGSITDVSLGTVTESTSSILTLSGWSNATVGSPTIEVKQSSSIQSGYLSSTDWNTFNSKQSAGNYISRLVLSVSVNTILGSNPYTDYVYLVSGSTSVTLPSAAGNTNRYTIKNTGTQTITIIGTVDGSTNILLRPSTASLDLVSNGTSWNII